MLKSRIVDLRELTPVLKLSDLWQKMALGIVDPELLVRTMNPDGQTIQVTNERNEPE